MKKTWMIYGATGYTGRLIAAQARRQQMQPIVAGRSAAATEALGRELGLAWRSFDLSDIATISAKLHDVDLVLHCAGPFSATSEPMLAACAQVGAHYIDITGELDVIEQIHLQTKRWAEAGIVAMPAAGFDVVPTDCVAAMLKRELPEGTHLRLAFCAQGGRPSRGTTQAIIEGLAKGGRVRRNGKIERRRFGHRRLSFCIGGRQVVAASVPWGDIATAYRTTGVGNIETYAVLPGALRLALPVLSVMRPGIASRPAQRWLKQLTARIRGLGEDERAQNQCFIFGDIRDARTGETASILLETPDAYTLTVESALGCVRHVRSGAVAPGAVSPASAMGADYVMGFEGVERLQ